MFECDFLIRFFGVLDNTGVLAEKPCYDGFNKIAPPKWNKELFTFTKSVSSWNESNTVKYSGVSIGEFQAHNNRDCLKFRFNMDGIAGLIRRGVI
jgi:hypothetical protein